MIDLVSDRDERDELVAHWRYLLNPKHELMVLPVQGAPAIGKGFQFKWLCRKLGWRYESTGDAMRAINRDGKQGDLSPDHLICTTVHGWLRNFSKCRVHRVLVIDGPIRSYAQAGFFDQICKELGISCWSFELTCDDDQELLARGRDGESREDDAYREKRIRIYRENRKAILEYAGFDDRRIEVNGLGSGRDVCSRILESFVSKEILVREPIHQPRGDQVSRLLSAAV